MTTRSRKLRGLAVATVLGVLTGLGVALPAAAQECYIGEVRWFAGNFAPRNWAFANGQVLAIADNEALYSILGTIYGGDGRTTFALPDLRGRFMVGAGQGPGLTSRRLGEKGGAEAVALTAAQMPAHAHPADTAVTATATLRAVDIKKNNVKRPGGNVLAIGDEEIYHPGPATVDMGASAIDTTATAQTTVGPSGSGQPTATMPPYQAINPIICLYGIYPSRS